MYNLFMTYWFIGIVFMCVYQLLSFIYVKLQGDKYIPYSEEETKPAVVVLFMNILLTFLYPLFIMVLIMAVLDYRQQEKQMAKMFEDLLKKIQSLEEKRAAEDECN